MKKEITEKVVRQDCVLTNMFNYELNQCSPVCDDYDRVVNHDEKGNEVIIWKKVDYSTLQKSLGTVEDWSLTNLLKAGISPDFPIHTGNPTRLEGLNNLGQFQAEADRLLSEIDKDKENKE